MPEHTEAERRRPRFPPSFDPFPQPGLPQSPPSFFTPPRPRQMRPGVGAQPFGQIPGFPSFGQPSFVLPPEPFPVSGQPEPSFFGDVEESREARRRAAELERFLEGTPEPDGPVVPDAADKGILDSIQATEAVAPGFLGIAQGILAAAALGELTPENRQAMLAEEFRILNEIDRLALLLSGTPAAEGVEAVQLDELQQTAIVRQMDALNGRLKSLMEFRERVETRNRGVAERNRRQAGLGGLSSFFARFFPNLDLSKVDPTILQSFLPLMLNFAFGQARGQTVPSFRFLK